MERKDRIDAFGVAALTGFSLLLGFNQVVIKVVNAGLQPVFFAGLRSAGAILCVWLILRLRGQGMSILPGSVLGGVLSGILFATEFVLLFIALDLTTVARASVLFYTMPVWLALAAHFTLPGERLTVAKSAGLVLALGGVAWALADRGAGGQASLAGDLCALAGAVCWAGIAYCARATGLARVQPEMQLMWQVVISAPLLLLVSPLFGPLVRDLQPLHLWGLAFQIVVVVSLGFSFWFWLLKRYPASGVVSFGFLTPVFGVLLGWLLLDEPLSASIVVALALVAAGLVLINRPTRRAVK